MQREARLVDLAVGRQAVQSLYEHRPLRPLARWGDVVRPF
jgi:hypothetical protein